MRKYLLFLLISFMYPLTGWSSVGDTFSAATENGGVLLYEIISDTECKVLGLSEIVANVVVPDQVTYEGNTYSVTTIGDDAFWNDTNMLTISLPASLVTIGKEAFMGCTSLQSITLPASLETIGESAFLLSGLTSVTIPSNVISIGLYAFDQCNDLISVSFSEGCQLTDIESSFSYCENLTTISLHEGLETIGEAAFSGCSSLENVTLPASLVTIGKAAFQECSNLKSITLSANLKTIGSDAFSECLNLQSITLPESLETIDVFAFSGCSKLTSITIPAGQIEGNAFRDCTSLSTLHIGKDVNSIASGSFYGCDLSTITIDETNETYYSPSGSNAIIERSEPVLVLGCKTTIIPSGVKHICVGAFEGCSGLTTIVIPEGVEFISNQAFSGCSNLSSVTLPVSLKWIGREAFSRCESLTAINIHQNVSDIGIRVFEGCINLATITVDENNGTYDSRNSCNAVIETSTNKLIAGCKSTIIPADVVIIDGNAFIRSGLTSIYIPKSVTTIEGLSFLGSTNLESIIIDPENSVYDSRDNCNAVIETSTNKLLFGCKATIIPDDVISIEEYAFYDSGLETITIPESVNSIGRYAFDCSSLETVILKSSTPPIITSSIFSDYISEIPTIYVPAGSRTTYIQTDGWKIFKDFIVEMEPEVQSFNIPVSVGKEWTTYYQDENDYTLSDGIEAYVVSDVDVEAGTVTLNAIDGIPKEVPVLLRSTNEGGFTDEDKMTTTVTAINVDVTPSTYYKGVTEATDISSEGTVYVLVGSKFVKADTSTGANTTIAANRCYISIPQANGARVMNIVIGDDTTNIKTLDAVQKDSNEKWYDLQGRHITYPTKKGIYVKTGKKVVIK